MKPAGGISCDQVAALLAFDDEQQRCDREALAAHLRGCAACNGEAPEIAALLGALTASRFHASPPPLSRPARRAGSRAVRMAAAVMVIAAFAVAYLRRPETPDRPAAAAPAPELVGSAEGPGRAERAAVAEPSEGSPTEITTGIVRYGGRSVTTNRITTGTWTPPRARIRKEQLR